MNLQDLDGNELGVIEVIENVKNDGDEGEGEEEIIYETVTEDVGVEGNVMATSMDEPESSGTRNMSQNNVSLGTELIRRMSGNMTTGKVSRKGERACIVTYKFYLHISALNLNTCIVFLGFDNAFFSRLFLPLPKSFLLSFSSISNRHATVLKPV